MERVELIEAVARAIQSDSRLSWHTARQADLAAAVAIRVVLAEVRREMRATFTHEATNGDQARAWALGRVLVVLDGLVPPPLV